MTDPHAIPPRRSAYAAKVEARASNPDQLTKVVDGPQWTTLTLDQLRKLEEARQFESAQVHAGQPRSWKADFKPGAICQIHGHEFEIVAVSKRGLVLHHKNGN
jgi:hypothetical protein